MPIKSKQHRRSKLMQHTQSNEVKQQLRLNDTKTYITLPTGEIKIIYKCSPKITSCLELSDNDVEFLQRILPHIDSNGNPIY